MISLISEITDRKVRRARSGWVFFDRDCSFCTAWARCFRGVLERRGYGLAALQDPRVQELLALPPDQLLLEMRVMTSAGTQFSGADAIVWLARQIWWAWPLSAFSQLPGAPRILRSAYRWVAAHRNCRRNACLRPTGHRECYPGM